MFTLKVINIPQVSYGWWARIRWPTDWYEPLQYYQDYAWEFRNGQCPPFEATVTFVKAPIDWNLVEIEIASEAWGPVVDIYGTRYGYFPAIIPMRSYTFQEGATYIADLATLALYKVAAALPVGQHTASIKWRNSGPAMTIEAWLTVGSMFSNVLVNLPENGEAISQHTFNFTTPGGYAVWVTARKDGVNLLTAPAENIQVV